MTICTHRLNLFNAYRYGACRDTPGWLQSGASTRGKVHARRGAALCKQIAGKNIYRSLRLAPWSLKNRAHKRVSSSIIFNWNPTPVSAYASINLDSPPTVFAMGRQQDATLWERQKGGKKTMKKTGWQERQRQEESGQAVIHKFLKWNFSRKH